MDSRRLLPVLLLCLLSTAASARAQCAEKSTSHTGLSGIPPFEANESCFVDDDEPELDVETEIVVGVHNKDYYFHTTRYIGEVDGDGFLADAGSFLAEDLIAEKVTMSLVARITRADKMGKLNQGYLDVQVILNEGTSGEKDLGPLEGAYTYENWGSRERWQLFEFEVNTEDLRFPDDPGCTTELYCNSVEPRQNKLTLKFSGMGVCMQSHPACADVEVDWISVGTTGDEGLAWRPTLMLHGLGSTSATMQSGQNVYANVLDGKGMAHHAISMIPHGSMRSNETLISVSTQELNERFGVDRVNAVGHSKGGIDGRHSVQYHNRIEHLVMVGAPNSGTPVPSIFIMSLADMMLTLASPLIDDEAGGNVEMTVFFMSGYNQTYRPNSNTVYVTQAGSNLDCGVWVGTHVIPGPDDCWVAVSSVNSLGYAAKYTYTSSDYATTHVGIRSHNTIGAQDAYDAYFSLRTAHESAAPAMRPAVFGKTNATTAPTIVAEAESRWQAGRAVEDGEVVPLTMTVDASDSLVVLAQWLTDDDIDVELVTPSLTRLTSATVTPGITYHSYTGDNLLSTAGFTVESPEAGEWTIELHGTTVADVDGAWVSVDAICQAAM